MAEKVKIKNATVTFSTMLNKLDNKLFGRMFSIKLPVDSPELKTLQTQFKELNETAKKKLTEKLGKPVKNSSKETGAGRDLFEESQFSEGFMELKFNIVNIRDREKTNEDGSITKEKYEVLNPIYKSYDFCYKVDGNGKKEYSTEKGKHWLPLHTNIVDITCSLVAGYDQKNNRVRIQLKADEVKILQSEIGSKEKGQKIDFITLDDENEDIENSVETSEETISADELDSLDI